MASNDRIAGLLSPYRVLDLTDELGFLCGKILGDLGADVVKVEPPGGDPARRLGPFYGNQPDPEKSLYWFGLTTKRRGISLILNSVKDADLFVRSAGKSISSMEVLTPAS